MHKIFLIIKREYLTRVKKKSFIIMSLLGPVLFAAMFAVPTWLATRDTDDTKVISIVDESGLISEALPDRGNLIYRLSTNDLATEKANMAESNVFGILHIPETDLADPKGITFFAESSAGMTTIGRIENALEERFENLKLEESQLDRAVIDGLRTSINIKETKISGAEETTANTGLYTGIGYLASLLIYMFIFMYGVQIMRGVVEEKTSRIVEVIISSVKPTQLMIGKILGVAAVGFTQFAIWILLSFGLYTVGLSTIGLNQERITQIQQMTEEEQEASKEFNKAQIAISNVSKSTESLPIPLLLGSFAFYF